MNINLFISKDYRKIDDFAVQKTNPIQTQFKPCPERSRMGQSNPVLPVPYQTVSCRHLVWEAQPALSVVEWVEWANFKWGRLLIVPMLPLYKLSNVKYYSRHNFKVKFPKISIISILRQAKLTKYRWKITPIAAIFNLIKKLTIVWTSDSLKGRRVIWRLC